MLNEQSPEKQIKSSGETLDIVSVFHTIQGEGPFTGHSAIFVRLAGCNLQCPFCDTDYTTDRRTESIESLYKKIYNLLLIHIHTKLIVITGGEPLRQNIVPLMHLLRRQTDAHIQIESNGVYPPTVGLTTLIHEGFVTYIVSPKTSRVSATAELWASAYKYVISADSVVEGDGLPQRALGHKASPYIARPPSGFKGKVYINPMDAQDFITNEGNMWAARDSAMKFGYVLGVQLHKLYDLP